MQMKMHTIVSRANKEELAPCGHVINFGKVLYFHKKLIVSLKPFVPQVNVNSSYECHVWTVCIMQMELTWIWRRTLIIMPGKRRAI